MESSCMAVSSLVSGFLMHLGGRVGALRGLGVEDLLSWSAAPGHAQTLTSQPEKSGML